MTTNSYALVTGATSGIGYELTKLLAKDGYNLVIVARNIDELNKTATQLKEEFKVEVLPISKDLFNKNAPFELYDEVRQKNIDIEILINDAGQGQYGEFIDTDIQRELDIIQLNVCSVVVLTKLFLQDMVIRDSGRILNLSSVASKIPGPWQSVYHGTKAFIQSFTEAIRSEVKDTKVTITALLPGATDTDFFNKADMLDAKNIQDEKKLSKPEDVAKEGYKALMAGDDKVIAGFRNKIQVAMSNLMPDEMVANNVNKQQEPVTNHK